MLCCCICSNYCIEPVICRVQLCPVIACKQCVIQKDQWDVSTFRCNTHNCAIQPKVTQSILNLFATTQTTQPQETDLDQITAQKDTNVKKLIKMCGDYSVFVCPIGCDQKVPGGVQGLQKHITTNCPLRLVSCPNECTKPEDIEYLMEFGKLKDHFKRCFYIHCEKCKAKI